MKITIELEDCKNYGLFPHTVYRKLTQEYSDKLKKNLNFKGSFWHYTSESTKDMYSKITGRIPNLRNLILTYEDAEICFEIFKEFADKWVEIYERYDEQINSSESIRTYELF